MKNLIDKLNKNKTLTHDEWVRLIKDFTPDIAEYAARLADKIRRESFGNKVYIRGLIEFTNYCKNNCYYCGIRCGNRNVERYRLTKEEILECCNVGYELGYRTFVLQGGEDKFYTDEIVCDIVATIRHLYPDVAITLSIGEKTKES